jgi:PEGA domain-containing protein
MPIVNLVDELASVRNPLLLFESEDAKPFFSSEGVEASSHAVTRRGAASNRRWLAGTFLLGVGMLIGYAGGVLTVTRTPERQNTSVDLFAPTSANSASNPAELHSQPAIIPSADAVSDERQVSERQTTSSTPGPSGGSVKAVQGGVVDSQFGVLRVESRPAGAQVHLDGELVTTTPFSLYRVPSGAHMVQMELDGYKPFTTSVNVIPGSHVRVAFSLEVDPDSVPR